MPGLIGYWLVINTGLSSGNADAANSAAAGAITFIVVMLAGGIGLAIFEWLRGPA